MMERRRILTGTCSGIFVCIAGCTGALNDNSEEREAVIEEYSKNLTAFENGFEDLRRGRDYMDDLEHSEAERWFRDAEREYEKGQNVWEEMPDLVSEANIDKSDFKQMLDLDSAIYYLGSAASSHRSVVRNKDDGEEIYGPLRQSAESGYQKVETAEYLTTSELEELLG